MRFWNKRKRLFGLLEQFSATKSNDNHEKERWSHGI